jgi:sugar phosphate isomerase/epimerase
MKSLNHLNWTFSTLGCPELSLGETIALAKRFSIKYLDLRTLEGRVDLPTLFKEQFGTPAALGDYLRNEGMEMAGMNSSLKLVGNDAASREAFLEFVEWAEATGTPAIRVFDGGTVAPDLPDEAYEAAMDTLTWWRDLKKKHGWKTDIGIETHDCLTSVAAIRRLQEGLEEPASLIWDTHHTWKKAGEAIQDSWKAVKPYTSHVHIKDSISKPSARHPFTYVQLGEGEFDLPGTLQLLMEDDFDGMVSIEWERQWHPYLPPVDTALQRARELGWW